MLLALLLGISGIAYASPAKITPGTYWRDTTGNILSAHGAGLIKVGSTYYLVGMYCDNDPNNNYQGEGHGMPYFVAITCYSSTDFANWTFENNLLTTQPSGDLALENWVGRPKIIYNDTTGQYVMYVNAGAGVGVATCSTVNGNYTYLGSYAPLGDSIGDMTVFKDDDGKAYLIGAGGKIYELTSDYLGVAGLTRNLRARNSEAPAMFKSGGVYFLLFSDTTWWTSNDNFYYTATSLSGSWTKRGDFTPNSDNTWDSQTTYVQPIEGSSTTTFVYLGDRWYEYYFGDSKYIWLPLTVDGTTLTMDWYDYWAIDTATGEWSIPSCPGIEDMHVQDVQLSQAAGSKGSNKRCRADVTIKDNCSNPIAGVTVTGTFVGISGTVLGPETVEAATDSNGVATLITTAEARKPSFEYITDSVTGGTLPYDPNDNVWDRKTFWGFSW